MRIYWSNLQKGNRKNMQHFRSINKHRRFLVLVMILSGLMLVGLSLSSNHSVAAQSGSPLHPSFVLLDEDGENVLDSGKPISTMQTCGTCHDTDFITEHSFHADVGLDSIINATDTSLIHDWDTSAGYFGRWDPITYRYLSPTGDERIDLTTADWIATYGARHVGGGPAVYGRDGTRLDELTVVEGDPETHYVDPQTGEFAVWDWQKSGVVEMNCFLCHTASPNNDARVAMLQAGDFQWANTATLIGTGVVEQNDNGWVWNLDAFTEDGQISPDSIGIQDPSSENCGQCHGTVHTDAQVPLTLDMCTTNEWTTATTGQVFSPQRLSNTGLNLSDKEELTRTWDVHNERVVDCTDCHYSLNNPIYYQESADSQPDHLLFDPRRLDFGDYLYRPLHQFATGQNAQSNLAPEFDNSLRRCESCHSIEATHDWLPYKDRHTSALSCETCHIPELYAPAVASVDWTVLRTTQSPNAMCRGVTDSAQASVSFDDDDVTLCGDGGSLTDCPDPEVVPVSDQALISGFEPVLLPRQNQDGSVSLAPYNLVTSFYWIYGDPARPVPLRDLQSVWFLNGNYHPDIVAAFDQDGDGELIPTELVIDSEAKENLIASRLEAIGIENPRIVGDIQPYGISHNVTHGEWAIRDCDTCHTGDSRITQSVTLSSYTPNGVIPTFRSTSATSINGDLSISDNGKLIYEPKSNTEVTDLYILGHDNVRSIDLFGAFLFLGIMVGVSVHSGLRYIATRKRAPHAPALRREYMYSIYERQWHWLQTTVIMGLLFTGLIIHKPDLFGMFSFRYVVQIHNVFGLILIVNAALAAFYNLVSGEIQQYLPRPRGFFNQAFQQTLFYLRGIFRGDPHPFEKSAERKLNPLQQVTYLMILNVLLPLQTITGVLMWGAQKWTNVSDKIGGLVYIGPLHSLVAWLFASFIVLHVYLTTTGHTPTAGIRAMILGWDDLEVHESPSSEEETKS